MVQGRRQYKNTREIAPEGLRIAAAEIESIVSTALGELLCDPGRLAEALGAFVESAGQQKQLLMRAREVAAGWPELPAPQLRSVVTKLCRRVTAHNANIEIEISRRELYALLGGAFASTAPNLEADHPLLLSLPVRLCRIGQGKRLVIDAALKPGMPGTPDPKLIKLLVRAHYLKETLRALPGTRIADLASREKLSPSYVALLLRLTSLAPDITRAILDGRQPAGFTAQKLVTYPALPFTWAEQRMALGFA
jgi:site-specific DNA recombinase